MATNVSAANMLSSYALFNATDIKQFIIDQLKANPDSPFKDLDYLGSNINAFIDIIAVMLQQLLFSYSVNASETSFSTALLYENMSRIVSLLNYKSAGKQTSILPVRFTVTRSDNSDISQVECLTIPKFLNVSYNHQYTLFNEETVYIPKGAKSVNYDTILYQGKVNESQIYTAKGDDFELLNLPDKFINNNEESFISDNFFTVYVDEMGDGTNWVEYQECSSLFLENAEAQKFERRFTEDFGYEFKFGNGIYGKKLKAGARIIIYYLISDGENAIIGNEILNGKNCIAYTSGNLQIIEKSLNSKKSRAIANLDTLVVQNTGPSTPISYPESVSSIRKNAPKVFASQGRLFSLGDYKTFINKNFGNYTKDVYFCKNDEYTKEYLKYYYDIGMASPQTDSRLNIAQVEFMSAVNFNNIYCFLVPAINTIINGKIPNYLNTALKKQIVNKAAPVMGISHNLVIIDPIYKAFTFGSYNIDNDEFNTAQYNNKLILVRNKYTKYSYNFIKNYCVDSLKAYFSTLKLGSTINTSDITQLINATPGIKSFYIEDENKNIDNKINLFVWNPLYSNEDNSVITQPYKCKDFEYPYFYDIDNLINKIEVIDE
ncbi:MAG: hypothetical protein IJ341_12635 [Bacteroidales bacterium]|nr:hypothetical protein [Bacteroidales bacterium]